MARLRLAVLGCVAAVAPAAADDREPPVHFEIGLNTRRFSARSEADTAIGSTLGGDARVWMAGFYIGVHSLEFGKR